MRLSIRWRLTLWNSLALTIALVGLAALVYGLLAFVIRRLAPWPWARNLALPLAIVVIVVLAFDRLYLEVHWESDVIGGILLGLIALVSATVWLDRPQPADN